MNKICLFVSVKIAIIRCHYPRQGLSRIEYLNTGRANSPKVWAVTVSLVPVVAAGWHARMYGGTISGSSSGSKLTLNNNKINQTIIIVI